MGEKVGYIRVSTTDQNPDRQLSGLELDRVYIDRVTGINLERPELKKLKEYVRMGDHLYIHSPDRLSRNSRDLHNIMYFFTFEKGVTVNFLNPSLVIEGRKDEQSPHLENPTSKLILGVMALCSELEYNFIKERQREGINLAKAKGVYKNCGRRKALTPDQVLEITEKVKLGIAISKIAREFCVSRYTIYNYIKDRVITFT